MATLTVHSTMLKAMQRLYNALNAYRQFPAADIRRLGIQEDFIFRIGTQDIALSCFAYNIPRNQSQRDALLAIADHAGMVPEAPQYMVDYFTNLVNTYNNIIADPGSYPQIAVDRANRDLPRAETVRDKWIEIRDITDDSVIDGV